MYYFYLKIAKTYVRLYNNKFIIKTNNNYYNNNDNINLLIISYISI